MSIMEAIYGALSKDTFTAHLPLTGADHNGKPNVGHAIVGQSYTGAWGSAGSRELEIASRLDVQVTAVVATSAPLTKNMLLKGLKGKDWLVTHVHHVHTHARAFLIEHRG